MQNDLQSKARWRLRLGILICVVAALVSLPCVLGLFSGEWKTVTIWGLPALGLFLLAEYVGFHPAIETYKHKNVAISLKVFAQRGRVTSWTGPVCSHTTA